MKLQLKLIVIAAVALLNSSCKKNKIAATQTPDNVVYQVAAPTCQVAEMFWLADNETILVNDFCNGTLKRINTTAKSVGLIDLVARGHLIQRMFYSEQLPQLFFTYHLQKMQQAVSLCPSNYFLSILQRVILF